MRVIEFSASSLSNMQKCHEYWNLASLENWKPNSKPAAFEKGDISHFAAKFYYTALFLNPSQNKLELIRDTVAVTREHLLTLELPIEEAERILAIVERYFHHYLDKDNFKILAVEKPFSKILFEGKDRRGQGITLVFSGVIDLLFESQLTKLTVMDHKTQGSSYSLIERTNQFCGYAWAFDAMYVIGNRIGLQKTTKDDDRFKRQTLNFSRNLLEQWKEQAIEYVLDAIEDYDRVKEGSKARYRTNFNSCPLYNGCDFVKVCSVYDPEVKLYTLMRDFYKAQKHEIYGKAKTDSEA